MATVTEAASELVSPVVPEPDTLYEVIDGQFVEKPPMGSHEYSLASILQEILGSFARSHGLGQTFMEVLFDLRPAVDRSLRPDVSFVSVDKYPLNRRTPERLNAWEMVPDLAVEIASPSNLAIDLLEKMEAYFRAGSRGVWFIYPYVKKVHVYQSPISSRIFSYEQTLTDEAILPGFQLPLTDLFGEEGD